MLIEILILAGIIEILCICGRAIFGSIRGVYSKTGIPQKYRMHHGYLGIILSISYLAFQNDLLLLAGIPLILSDAIHHFIVLPLWVKKTEFP